MGRALDLNNCACLWLPLWSLLTAVAAAFPPCSACEAETPNQCSWDLRIWWSDRYWTCIWVFPHVQENTLQDTQILVDEISVPHVISVRKSLRLEETFGGHLVHVGYLNLTQYVFKNKQKKLCWMRSKGYFWCCVYFIITFSPSYCVPI